MENIKILIDTDLGDDVDDAAAVMLALGCPALTVLGITTVYKDTCRRGEMVKDLLAQWGREDIPVHIGRGSALLKTEDKEPEKPIQYGLLETGDSAADKPVWHGLPEKEKCGETAVDFILDTVRKNPDVVIFGDGLYDQSGSGIFKGCREHEAGEDRCDGGRFF